MAFTAMAVACSMSASRSARPSSAPRMGDSGPSRMRVAAPWTLFRAATAGPDKERRIMFDSPFACTGCHQQ